MLLLEHVLLYALPLLLVLLPKMTLPLPMPMQWSTLLAFRQFSDDSEDDFDGLEEEDDDDDDSFIMQARKHQQKEHPDEEAEVPFFWGAVSVVDRFYFLQFWFSFMSQLLQGVVHHDKGIAVDEVCGCFRAFVPWHNETSAASCLPPIFRVPPSP